MYLKERVYEKVGRYISLRIETAGFWCECDRRRPGFINEENVLI
jgi:hypothetical protein